MNFILYLLLLKLNLQLSDIKNSLLDEEFITLEIEKLPWYIQLEGKKNEWSLRFVFESQEETRSFEMYWPIPIAQKLFHEVKNMGINGLKNKLNWKFSEKIPRAQIFSQLFHSQL